MLAPPSHYIINFETFTLRLYKILDCCCLIKKTELKRILRFVNLLEKLRVKNFRTIASNQRYYKPRCGAWPRSGRTIYIGHHFLLGIEVLPSSQLLAVLPFPWRRMFHIHIELRGRTETPKLKTEPDPCRASPSKTCWRGNANQLKF